MKAWQQEETLDIFGRNFYIIGWFGLCAARVFDT